MTTKGTDNRFRSLTVVGESGTPSTPASGDFKLYVADDGTFYLMDDTGTTAPIGGGGFSDPMTTRGDIIVRNASNVTARLAKGSADTFLHSDGTDVGYAAVTDAMLSTSDITTNNASTSKHGFAPKYPNDATKYLDGTGAYSVPAGSGGGGSMVWLQRQTASSSATLDFTSFISSTYDTYVFKFVQIVNASDADFIMRIGTGGGPTYDSTAGHYDSDTFVWRGGGTAQNRPTSPTAFTLSYSGGGNVKSSGGLPVVGTVTLYDPQNTTQARMIEGQIVYMDTTPFRVVNMFRGSYETTGTAFTAVRFLFTTGNITSGFVDVYGLKHS